MKCDNEPSTNPLQDAVIHACAGVEVIPQGPPEGDRMANGRVEMALREVGRQCGTLRIYAEQNTSVRISDDSPLLSWLHRFAAQVMNKMRIGKDGKRSEGNGKSKDSKGKFKGKSKGTKGANGKGETSKTGLSGLDNSETETSSETQESAQTYPTDNSYTDWYGDDWSSEWNDDWSFDEWNDDWSSVGWHEGWEQTYDTSACSFSLGGLDVSATSSPKRFEWAKMTLDTGAAVNTFPLNFGSEGEGDGRFYRTASGEWTLDGGAWQFKGYDENGLLRLLNGRLTGAHKVLCSSAEVARVRETRFLPGI